MGYFKLNPSNITPLYENKILNDNLKTASLINFSITINVDSVVLLQPYIR